MKKKELLTALVVACIAVMSLSVLVYAATWTPEQMADWMYRVGKPKIWKILRNTNEMKPMVEDIQDKIGQGLVGEWESGTLTTALGYGKTLWSYNVPDDNPKKVSVWINLENIKNGDEITVWVSYDSDADGAYENAQDTATRTFTWNFHDDQGVFVGVLIVDELPVVTLAAVTVYQSGGTAFKIDWHAIVEEL